MRHISANRAPPLGAKIRYIDASFVVCVLYLARILFRSYSWRRLVSSPSLASFCHFFVSISPAMACLFAVWAADIQINLVIDCFISCRFIMYRVPVHRYSGNSYTLPLTFTHIYINTYTYRCIEKNVCIFSVSLIICTYTTIYVHVCINTPLQGSRNTYTTTLFISYLILYYCIAHYI